MKLHGKSLKESGYLVQHKLQDESGRIYYEYELLDEKNHTPKKEGVEKAGLGKAPHGKSSTGKRGVYNNTNFNKTLNNNTYGIKKDTHTRFNKECNTVESKNMCVDNPSYLEKLQKQIKDIIDEKIGIGKLTEILRNISIERINYHLEHWHIHKKNQVKTGAGYFITVVMNDIEPVEPEKKSYNQSKIPQRDNFDQRDYTDEELEKFYANL